MSDQFNRFVCRAAEHYLCHPLPQDWVNMAEADLYEFLERFAWEPFEHCSGEFIWRAIHGLAKSFGSVYEEGSKVA